MYSPTRPNPGGGGETCAETGINIFFTKVGQCNLWSNKLELMIRLANVLMSYHDGVLQINKLAAVRINGMVERLQLSQQIRESVYRLFQHVLAQRTSLLFNRHIDQIILCCFYGVAKVSSVIHSLLPLCFLVDIGFSWANTLFSSMNSL